MKNNTNKTPDNSFNPVSIKLQLLASLASKSQSATTALQPAIDHAAYRISVFQTFLDDMNKDHQKLSNLASALSTVASMSETLNSAYSRPVPDSIATLLKEIHFPTPPSIPPTDPSLPTIASAVSQLAQAHLSRVSRCSSVFDALKQYYDSLILAQKWFGSFHALLTSTHELVSTIKTFGDAKNPTSPTPHLPNPDASAAHLKSTAASFQLHLATTKTLLPKISHILESLSSLTSSSPSPSSHDPTYINFFSAIPDAIDQISQLSSYLSPRRLRLLAHAISSSK